LKQRVVARRRETRTQSVQLSREAGSNRSAGAFCLNKDEFWEERGKVKKVEIKKWKTTLGDNERAGEGIMKCSGDARDQIKIRGESQAKNHKFHVFN